MLDQNGQPVAGADVNWSSSDDNVATVSSSGLVTAVMNGTAQITATGGNASASVTVTVMATQREREALIALYHSTSGPNWNNETNWLSNEPLGTWHGVSTNIQGEVTSLSLSENYLLGMIPSEIGQLTDLTGLYIGNNRLIGAIPPEIGQLQNLIGLALSNNHLTGSVPPEFGQLDNLTYLWLNGNAGLSGALPLEMTRIKHLEILNLNDTQICVPQATEFHEWLNEIPTKFGIAYCPSLERDALIALYESTDGLNWTNSTDWTSFAPLGEWYGVTTDVNGMVTDLVLTDNNLSGLLPSQVGDLARLELLDLSSNPGLSGPIPHAFTRLGLQELNLEGTQLCAPLDAGFQEWLEEIPQRNVTNCTEMREDFFPLVALYNRTNGQEWTNSTNWLSKAPLDTWYGVSTNANGDVTRLSLAANNLNGPIPPELAQLASLETLVLWGNGLTGAIPPEIGQLSSLKYLNLSSNRLTGTIPPEIGKLNSLTGLYLIFNQFTGVIPPEIAQLQDLTEVVLSFNSLSGSIPAEMSQLQKLAVLRLTFNQLTGSIPPVLGQLHNLTSLELGDNQLTGLIPPELGQLQNLTNLKIGGNQLTGSILLELGQLQNLAELGLSHNNLSGSIPPELGHLRNLTSLGISDNRLTGNIPHALGDLSKMKSLRLSRNPDMVGTLPLSLINLDLDELLLGGTRLCAPEDPAFQDWLQMVPISRVSQCTHNIGGAAAYLTQATQSLEYPVPLVAGEDALLRVFVTSNAGGDITMPTVQATFYQSGAEVYSIEIPGDGASIPHEIDESDLAVSANTRVPGSVLMPGLEMLIEIDPDRALDPSLGILGRLPPTGRMAVDVRNVPPFELTLVPFLWIENPDRSILTEVEVLTSESDLFRPTRDVLPIRDFALNLHEPEWVSVEPVQENIDELYRYTQMIRTMEGSTGHYLGILNLGGGLGETPGTASVASLVDWVIAHELGHNLSLIHAPCGTPGDTEYPYPSASIGAWGYDLFDEKLVDPGTYKDLMSFCHPQWISDYNFNKAMAYRQSQEQLTLMAAAYASSTRSLLLWGGVNSTGELVLEPAFVVEAPPSMPQLDGPYRITGEGQDGDTLFSLSFGMAEISDGEGGSFAFILPVQPDWATRLQSITLSGPEGVSSLDGADDPTAALLLDPVTGKVRGLLRDWPDPPTTLQAARRTLPEPGLEVVISQGVPDQADW